jgi:hypothetical protein
LPETLATHQQAIFTIFPFVPSVPYGTTCTLVTIIILVTTVIALTTLFSTVAIIVFVITGACFLLVAIAYNRWTAFEVFLDPTSLSETGANHRIRSVTDKYFTILKKSKIKSGF